MMTFMLLIAAIAMEAADTATMHADGELNPVALSPLGILAKLLLVVVLVAGAWSERRTRRWYPVLLFAIGWSAFGVWSNL